MKKIAVLLVLVFLLSAFAFALSACNEEEKTNEFDKYKMARYLETYTYKRVEVYRQGAGGWYNFSNTNLTSDKIHDWFFMMSYRDTPANRFNGIYLALQDCLKKIGMQITIERERTIFSGSIGEIPSVMVCHNDTHRIGLKLDLTNIGEVDIPFNAKNEITAEWYPKKIADQPVYSHDETVCTIIYTDPEEVDGEIYRFCIVHSYNITQGQ